MNHIAKYLCFGAAIMAMPAICAAGVIDFESNAGVKAVGVYDAWEQSPFRSGVLTGNVAVTANPFADEVGSESDEPLNGSATVLGAQRSRFGSNRFGVRIDLEESFKLTPELKYVHVLIHKPIDGRVMLVGLGSRTERLGQEPYTEQFWELTSSAVNPDEWCDAVFPVKGAGGIDVRSLVVVPHCESPHALNSDFLFYIDDIEINNSPTPRIVNDYYLVNGDKSTWKLDRPDRYTNSVSISGSADGDQTVAVSQQSDKLVYQDRTSSVLSVRPGESITPSISFEGAWMHGYFYIDFNNDGKFDPVINSNGTVGEGSELVAYSFLPAGSNENGVNSAGTSLSGNQRNTMVMPAYTIPANLAPGMYRVRFKVDWASAEPGGSSDPANLIDANGGSIVDVMLHVHNAEVSVNDNQLNGEVLAADGSKLDAFKTPYKQQFSVKMNPEKGFVHEGFTMYCGYNFSGKPVDKFGNRQYTVYTVGKGEFAADDTYTIAADRMAHGDVLIVGNMVEDKTSISAPEAAADEASVIYGSPGPSRGASRSCRALYC